MCITITAGTRAICAAEFFPGSESRGSFPIFNDLKKHLKCVIRTFSVDQYLFSFEYSYLYKRQDHLNSFKGFYYFESYKTYFN